MGPILVLVMLNGVVVSASAATLADGTEVTSPGAPAPKREGMVFKTELLSSTEHSPRVSTVSVRAWDTSTRESDSVEKDRFVGTHEFKKESDLRHLRLAVRTTQSSRSLRDLKLHIQYFSKPAGGSGDPRVTTQKQIPLAWLDSRLVYVDVAPVSIDSLSQSHTSRRGREFSKTTGDMFYGYIVSVVDADNAVHYQGASSRTLAKLAKKPSAQVEEEKQQGRNKKVKKTRRVPVRPFRRRGR
jgi:hypothetical protein